MKKLFKTSWLLLLGFSWPMAVIYAHGQAGLAVPILAVLGLHMLPAADLIRKREFDYAVFYFIMQPVFWWQYSTDFGHKEENLGKLVVSDWFPITGLIAGGLVFFIMLLGSFVQWCNGAMGFRWVKAAQTNKDFSQD